MPSDLRRSPRLVYPLASPNKMVAQAGEEVTSGHFNEKSCQGCPYYHACYYGVLGVCQYIRRR